MAEPKEVYIGIDLNDTWTQVSYMAGDGGEPETLSLVAGEEHYRIPTALCQVPGKGTFQLPDSHGQRAREQGIRYLDRLWSRSLAEEQLQLEDASYEMKELLLIFLKKLLRMVPVLSEFSQIGAVSIHLEEVAGEGVALLQELLGRLEIPRECVYVQDDKESFCHFAMNQEKSLNQYENVLFVCPEDQLYCYVLARQGHTSPATIRIDRQQLWELPTEPEARDAAFGACAAEVLQGRMVSAVYLTGDGLEGGWMKESLNVLCRGRRVFQGRNLYTRGACYGSAHQCSRRAASYVFFGDFKLKHNIFLKVNRGDNTSFWELAEAGTSRYEVSTSCQVLLSGDPQLEVWMREPGSREAEIEALQLVDLPKRPDRMTRLKLELKAGADQKLRIKITDLGFGSWYPASGNVWEYCINE